jgi:hypothetical protein
MDSNMNCAGMGNKPKPLLEKKSPLTKLTVNEHVKADLMKDGKKLQLL